MRKQNKNKNPIISYKKIKRFFLNLSTFKIILITYTSVTLIAALLLFLPISVQENQNVTFLDALFTAASAFSDTGLITKTTAHTWTEFGQAIIAILILLGGICLLYTSDAADDYLTV